jgi:transposase-like protein
MNAHHPKLPRLQVANGKLCANGISGAKNQSYRMTECRYSFVRCECYRIDRRIPSLYDLTPKVLTVIWDRR